MPFLYFFSFKYFKASAGAYLHWYRRTQSPPPEYHWFIWIMRYEMKGFSALKPLKSDPRNKLKEESSPTFSWWELISHRKSFFYLKSILGLYWPGSGVIKFCGSGSGPNQSWSTSMLDIYQALHILAQIYTANHATFLIQIYAITRQICGNFWGTQYHCWVLPPSHSGRRRHACCWQTRPCTLWCHISYGPILWGNSSAAFCSFSPPQGCIY